MQHFWNVGSTVNQITNENRSATIWRSHTWYCRSFVDLVTELNEQSGQLFVATVHVPDDVERSVLMFQVVPKRLSHDRDRGDLLWTRQHEDMGGLIGGSLTIQGYFARMMYLSLYKMHEYALHGFSKVVLDTLARMITRRTEPHVKLH